MTAVQSVSVGWTSASSCCSSSLWSPVRKTATHVLSTMLYTNILSIGISCQCAVSLPLLHRPRHYYDRAVPQSSSLLIAAYPGPEASRSDDFALCLSDGADCLVGALDSRPTSSARSQPGEGGDSHPYLGVKGYQSLLSREQPTS